MKPSRYLPTAAFTVALCSLFAPPVFGLLGVASEPKVRESALVIEQQPVTLASVEIATTRPLRQAAQQCQSVDPIGVKAPASPLMRTVVADLGPMPTGGQPAFLGAAVPAH